MKIISFNINGIRARLHQLQQIIDTHSPDVIGLQECKVHDDSFPLADVESMGYRAHFHGQKGHYGVALLSKQEPLRLAKGYPTDTEEAQRRLITGTYQCPDGSEITVINGYFPQGENRAHEIKFPAKRKFYADLMNYLDSRFTPKDPLVIMGDFNISPQDIDIGIGEKNAQRWLSTGKCSFLPEEREWYQKLMGWGFEDTYRKLYPESTELFSWFDYRSRGFEDNPKRGLRIDHILATATLLEKLNEGGIDYEIRGSERPSDHCPVWAKFGLCAD